MIEHATSQERELITKLRSLFSNSEQECISKFKDGRLLRWLRNNDGNVEKTVEALQKHIIFRRAWDLDNLLNWKPPEVLESHVIWIQPGTDKEGSPVFIQPFGSLDVQGVFKSCMSSDYIRQGMRNLMIAEETLEKLAEEKGIPYDLVTLAYDLNGMSSDLYLYKPFTSSFLTLISIVQENFPFIFKRILVLRAPSIAQYAYTLLTPFLSVRIQELVELTVEADWKTKLFDKVDKTQLPHYWGGTQEDPDKLTQRLRAPIPETYFWERGSVKRNDVTDTTLYAGDARLMDFDITEPGTKLKWWYYTEALDVGFAVYRRSSESPDPEILGDVVFPYIRLESSVIPETGFVTCETPGTYTVEFDNKYSWFSAKELSYAIEVVMP